MHSLIAEIINIYLAETPNKKVPYTNIQALCYGAHIHEITGDVKQVRKKDGGVSSVSVLVGSKVKRLYVVNDKYGIKCMQGAPCRFVCVPVVVDGLIQYQTIKEQNSQKCVDLNADPFQVKIVDFQCRDDWEFGIQSIPLSRVSTFEFQNGRGIGFNYTAG